jgi:hypothetical protein
MQGGKVCRLRLERDGTRAETRFRLSQKRTRPFKSAGASVQSTAVSRGVRISFSNAGYTTFRGSVRVLATHSIRQFPLHFPSCASPCAIKFQMHSTYQGALTINICQTLREYCTERVKVCTYRDLLTINHVSLVKVCSCHCHLTMPQNKPESLL